MKWAGVDKPNWLPRLEKRALGVGGIKKVGMTGSEKVRTSAAYLSRNNCFSSRSSPSFPFLLPSLPSSLSPFSILFSVPDSNFFLGHTYLFTYSATGWMRNYGPTELTCAYMHTYKYTHTHIPTHTQTYTHTYTQTHTYTHAHTHTHTLTEGGIFHLSWQLVAKFV